MSEIESETLREVTSSLDDGRWSIVGTVKEGRLYLAGKAGKRFVLKTASGAQSLELLKREYEMSIGLSHPGLAYIYTWEEDTPVGPCLVQEYIDGRTLSQWLSESPSAGERRRIFGELLSVTGYLHGKGIVHNDLKPDNILISRTGGALKLIDLGFADSDAYIHGALGGTRGYASPELLAGGTVDARSDVYSLGLMLREFFPRRYGHIVRKCTRHDPSQRYASASEMLRSWKRSGLWWKIALGVLVAGLAVLPLFRKPVSAEGIRGTVDSLQYVVDSQRSALDSLQGIIAERDRVEAANAAALADAKARIEEVYKNATTKYRKALAAATTRQEAMSAWLTFLEDIKVVTTEIPLSVPEAVRPALRDYTVDRNYEVESVLSKELTEKTLSLSE